MSDKLERTVEEYRNKVLSAHKLVRSHPYRNVQKKPKKKPQKGKNYNSDYWDYPTVVVSCGSDNATASGHSCEARKNSFSITELNIYLKDKLGNDLGKRSKVKGCGNPIGNCAEDHAVNNLLRKTMKKATDKNINKIKFSKAFYTRTGISLEYCDNCTTAFNIHN